MYMVKRPKEGMDYMGGEVKKGWVCVGPLLKRIKLTTIVNVGNIQTILKNACFNTVIKLCETDMM